MVESKLDEPYNNCLKDVSKFKKNKTLIDLFSTKNRTYSQEDCFDLCFDLFYIKENPCQCIEAELGSVIAKCWIEKESTKSGPNFTGCTWKYRTKFQKERIPMCFDYCPLECDSISISYSINAYDSNASKDYVTIYVFYKTLKYTSITQQAKTKGRQLVSNLGGYLGLFVGLSFVSLFEIAEILIEMIYILFGKQKRIKPQERSDNERISNMQSELEKVQEQNQQLANLLAQNQNNIKHIFSLVQLNNRHSD